MRQHAVGETFVAAEHFKSSLTAAAHMGCSASSLRTRVSSSIDAGSWRCPKQ